MQFCGCRGRGLRLLRPQQSHHPCRPLSVALVSHLPFPSPRAPARPVTFSLLRQGARPGCQVTGPGLRRRLRLAQRLWTRGRQSRRGRREQPVHNHPRPSLRTRRCEHQGAPIMAHDNRVSRLVCRVLGACLSGSPVAWVPVVWGACALGCLLFGVHAFRGASFTRCR